MAIESWEVDGTADGETAAEAAVLDVEDGFVGLLAPRAVVFPDDCAASAAC